MLKNCDEEDFYELKSVSEDRLLPDGIAVFFCATFILGAIFALVSVNALNSSIYINHVFWIKTITANIIILIIQLIIAIFFISLKKSYGHQKVQAVLLCILSIKISIEGYQCFFLYCEDSQLPDYVGIFGRLILIGGFLFIVISTLRGVNRVKKGYFRKGGKYLYDFKNSKIYVSSPFIYGIIMLGGVLSRNLSGSNNNTSNIVYAFFLLIIMAIIQYGIAMAWPEFFLLAYCKFRFAIFNEKMSKTLLTEVKNSKSPKKNLQGIKEGLNKMVQQTLIGIEVFRRVESGEKSTN